MSYLSQCTFLGRVYLPQFNAQFAYATASTKSYYVLFQESRML